MLTGGGLQAMIDQGLLGMTSNPTIFEKAIGGSSDYDAAMQKLVARGATVEQIYDALTIEDVGTAADLFRPVFERTQGKDGYVSIEVSPRLAHDTAGTLADARRLWADVEAAQRDDQDSGDARKVCRPSSRCWPTASTSTSR